MGALQYVDCPNYHALILRRSFQQLAKPGSLLDLSKEWLMPWRAKGEVHWSGQYNRWTFPSGASLTFGHMENDDSVYLYQGPAFLYVAYDELTQFTEWQYRYLFSRLRKGSESELPVRMRAASNPGGLGHQWVKDRFIRFRPPGRIFIRAYIADNPSLNREDYIESLKELDPITKAQMLAGDWDAFQGGRFSAKWFMAYKFKATEDRYYLEGRDPQGYQTCDCWRFITVDPACSEKETADYTAIGVWQVTRENDLMLLEMIRKRLAIDRIVPEIAQACGKWGPDWVAIEASSFQWAIVNAAKRHPDIPSVRGIEPEGKGKLARATPAIIRAGAGQIFLPEHASWVEDFVAECVQFTGDPKEDAHDDQVDCLAYAVQELDRSGTFLAPTSAIEDRPAAHTFGKVDTDDSDR